MAGTILQEGGCEAGAGFGCGRVPVIAAAGLRKGGWCGELGVALIFGGEHLTRGRA